MHRPEVVQVVDPNVVASSGDVELSGVYHEQTKPKLMGVGG